MDSSTGNHQTNGEELWAVDGGSTKSSRPVISVRGNPGNSLENPAGNDEQDKSEQISHNQ